jgi:hypothetical protein
MKNLTNIENWMKILMLHFIVFANELQFNYEFDGSLIYLADYRLCYDVSFH